MVRRGRVLLQNSMYRPAASLIRCTLPMRSDGTVRSGRSRASSIATSASSESLPPSRVKNLTPLS